MKWYDLTKMNSREATAFCLDENFSLPEDHPATIWFAEYTFAPATTSYEEFVPLRIAHLQEQLANASCDRERQAIQRELDEWIGEPVY